jgi:hypothetical protein
MKDLTLPKVGASFKKWKYCTPFSQNARKFFITPTYLFLNHLKKKIDIAA